MLVDEPFQGDISEIESTAMSITEDQPDGLIRRLLNGIRVGYATEGCIWAIHADCIVCKFTEHQRPCIQALRENATSKRYTIKGTYMRLTTPAEGMYLPFGCGLVKDSHFDTQNTGFAATIPVAEAMMTNLSGFLKEKKRVVPQGTPNTSKRFAPGSSGQHQGQRGPHQGPSGSQQGLWGSSRGSSGQQQGLRGSHQSPSGPKQSTSGPHLGTGGPHQSAQS
ncbi:MAG: hypothetical protein J3Q66DRAFT_445963 [Benniella sp.]|nr:MAG: hypothetical protein J3Q66DRAFT_445963 [Benniella sp.]